MGKCAMDRAEERGYGRGLQGLEGNNPYANSKYGFGAGFRNCWRRGYRRGKDEKERIAKLRQAADE